MQVWTGWRRACSSWASCWICTSTWGNGGPAERKPSPGAVPAARASPSAAPPQPAAQLPGPQPGAPPCSALATASGCVLAVGRTWGRKATAAWLYLQLFFIKELTSICLFKVGSLILLKTCVMPPLSAHYQMSLECFILLLALGTNAVIPGASRFCYLTV